MNAYIDKKHRSSKFKTHWMTSKNGKEFWCRRAVALMGGFNMSYEKAVKMSPFDPEFRDNFVQGRGHSKEEALSNMEKEEELLSNMLWM